MSEVRLEPVTAANWRECAALTVRPDQTGFVAPVTYYLCLCAYGSTWQPLAIYRDSTVAQRAGIARSAISLLIQRFEAEDDCAGVALSYSPANAAAKELYASLEFRETGETADDGAEVVARRARSARA